MGEVQLFMFSDTGWDLAPSPRGVGHARPEEVSADSMSYGEI